ncbi:hypothetical protein [Poseidonibacter ostreae]|uniref:Uncharacterized protein n=1 Tax=Poseidonibacter ostreae TaxID=2654171 RepID=A0A6L4WX27_9BACT|nr:hypothetical protein [Poseidonibacter ostreae]KAB7891431.1 hypothetical protein GBG19_00920 [Poseidonibacter ostreae]
MLNINLIRAVAKDRNYSIKRVPTDDGMFIVVSNKNDAHDWCEFLESETTEEKIIKRMREE